MSDTVTEKECILDEVLKLLAEQYPRGLYDWLYAHDRGTCDEINHLEDEINQNFLRGGSIDDLKVILRSYWTVHMEAIRWFNGSGKPETSLRATQAERIRELESAHV